MRISQRAFVASLVSASLFLGVTGFNPVGPSPTRVGSSNLVLWLTPEEERAALLSDYLAKSHEEKLKAVRAIEEKKDAEISRLKEKLKESQSAPAPPTSAAGEAPSIVGDVEALSKDELVSAVASYQQFMAKYIVDAQEQKTAAVKAAEAAVTQKYESTIKSVTDGKVDSGTTAPAPEPEQAHTKPVPAPTPAPAPISEVEKGQETTPAATQTLQDGNLYAQRNARVVAAAQAGKSRWGYLEVDRAVFLSSLPASETKNGVASVETDNIPPEVVAADHGLRNDGGVGGLTLAERVAMGADAGSNTVNGAADATSVAPPPVPAEMSANEKLFQQRNERVAASAKAGKSRWGDMEVTRIQNSVASVSESKAADIVAADHGLQPDQGVSLADRVNLGARLLGK